jgi:hypothetical protein
MLMARDGVSRDDIETLAAARRRHVSPTKKFAAAASVA